MPETILKLQPHRSMYLRGFNRFGAAAALTLASDSGFTVSGVFRDMADFAVVMLWDADNIFEHPSIKYLPDFDFTGMVLSFDLTYSGLQMLDSVRSNWIDWATLDYIAADGATGQIPLFDPTYTRSVPSGGAATHTKASATFTVNGAGCQPYDRTTLWYLNYAFDFIVPGGLGSSAAYWWQDKGGSASITVGATTYTYNVTTPGGESGTTIAAGVAAAASVDPLVSFSAVSNSVLFCPKANTGATVTVAGYTLWLITGPPSNWIAMNLAAQINAATFTASIGFTAISSGATVTITATKPGLDGNALRIYEIHKTSTLTCTPSVIVLAGGVTPATWHMTFDFSALGVRSIRKAWLTFAPKLPFAALYADTNWSAIFANWTVTDPGGKRPLKVAGNGSVRVKSRDPWAVYSGAGWGQETGWYSDGFARRASSVGDSVTVAYTCQSAHNLYVGTSLYSDRGTVGVRLDGVAQPDVNCHVTDDPAIQTRRLLASSVAAGKHSVQISLKSGLFYFDFLEAAVLANVPDAAVVYPNVTAALDYDTDATYKLAPDRVAWNLEKLGLMGQVNEYLGVFWWNNRKRIGGIFKTAAFTIGGTWADQNTIVLRFGTDLSPTDVGKTVFPTDTVDSIANHFVYAINALFVAVWAEKTGTGTFAVHQFSPEWDVPLRILSVSSTGGTVTMSPTLNPLTGGTEGAWTIDDSAATALNVAATAWHQDFFARLAARGMTAATSISMELVNPPEGAGSVYVARFADSSPVATSTGFSNLVSNHCSFTAKMRALQTKAFCEIAGLQASSGLTPWLQFGEFLWWFYPKSTLNVMAASNATPIEIRTTANHGRATGETVIVSGVPGNTAANGTRSITVTAADRFTLNGSAGTGIYTGGGLVACGGMAYYDTETATAAQPALGRPLASFWTQDSDPTVNGSADANWLAARMKAHIDGIRTTVLASYPAAKFELLFPNDVNRAACYSTADVPYAQGGRLNRAVNLPSAYLAKSGSGLDRMKVEALSWSISYRNVDLAKEAIAFPGTSPMSWARADTAYLVPINDPGCPWQAEYLTAVNSSVPLIVLWAFDHLAIYSWKLPLPVNGRSSIIR